MGALKDFRRGLAMFLGGWTATILVSTTALGAAAFVTGYPFGVAFEMLVATALIRIGYNIIREPRQLFSPLLVRTRLKHVLSDEIQIGIAFSAAAYALQWPAAQTTIALFLTTNLLLQTAVTGFSRRVLRRTNTLSKGKANHDQSRFAIIVGTGHRARAITDSLLKSPELAISIRGFLDYRKAGLWSYRDIPLLGHPDHLQRISSTEQVDVVVLAVEPEDLLSTRELFADCEKTGIAICLVPDLYQSILAKMQPTYLNGTPVLAYRTAPASHRSLIFKNMVDKVGAIVGLILSAPLLLLTALAIKIDSKGPVLFKQRRCGLNGKQFALYKFRTMCHDAERKKKEVQALNTMSGPVFKAPNDPRVTRIGRYLRKWSIDEIPQFVNVIRGDMSLVGPRPPLPAEVARYEPWQRRRLSVKPGVTCLWQVNGRNHVDFEEWMRLDLQYIDNWSPWLDAKILAKTVPAVLRGTGAS